MSDAVSKLVPGFDFLQGLVKGAGNALPGMPGLGQIADIGKWVAPTLNPEELGKRIEELRTVQFWLEQNARMLAATIQALEVQRMTLSTLKTMNVPLQDLRDALKLPEAAASSAAPAVKAVAKKAVKKAVNKASQVAGPAAVDPMQWWGALTQQFSQVAANAVKDSASEAAKGLAKNLVKQSIDAAGDTLRTAASVPGAVAKGLAGVPAPAAQDAHPATLMRWLAAHATHPDARVAAQLALAPLRARIQAEWGGDTPTLGLAYFTDALAPQAQALLLTLQAAWPGMHWAGAASVGVMADGAEYLDEPALALFIGDLDPSQVSAFSGIEPLRSDEAPGALLVHADPALPELMELLAELAQRAAPALAFGGLAASRTQPAQLSGQVLGGGLSGLRFGPGAGLRVALTQGCQPLAPARQVTAAEGPLVLALDGEPALPLLLRDLGLDPTQPRAALVRLRGTLLGLRAANSPPPLRPGALDDQVRVRHLLGLDLQRQALAVGDGVAAGDELVLCQRHAQAALRDLRHMATALRAQVEDEGRRATGAIYISCAGRGGSHFGAPHLEAQTLQQALGDLPTIGFFAGGEVMGGQLYGYSGVLALFTAP